MGIFRSAAMSAAFLSATGAFAANTCPKWEPGHTYPWQIDGIMADDQYADVYIDIDEQGRPLKCYIGKTNIPRDDRFWVCKAYLDDWHVQPIIEDGKAVRGTVHRVTILTGDKHDKANRDARKQWFRDHPAERPECYPE
jgi:hypothetical protein